MHRVAGINAIKELECTKETGAGDPIYASINDLSGPQHILPEYATSSFGPLPSGDIELQLMGVCNMYESEEIIRRTPIIETKIDSVANCISPQQNAPNQYLSFVPSLNDKADSTSLTYEQVDCRSRGTVVVLNQAKVDEMVLTEGSAVLSPSTSDEYLDVRSDTAGCSQVGIAADLGTAYTNTVMLLSASVSTAPTDNEYYIEVNRSSQQHSIVI